MQALSVIAKTDGGIAIGSTAAAIVRFVYPDVAKRLRDYDVVSHTPPAKPFRGPGGAPVFWALEQTVDAAAERCGVDPVDIRAGNDSSPSRLALLNWVRSLPVWRDRARHRPRTRTSYAASGMAAGAWMYFTQPSTEVTVRTEPGGLVVSTACQDLGTGTRTVLATVVAEDLRPFAICGPRRDWRFALSERADVERQPHRRVGGAGGGRVSAAGAGSARRVRTAYFRESPHRTVR